MQGNLCGWRKPSLTGAFCISVKQNMNSPLDIDQNLKVLKDLLRWLPVVIGIILFKIIGLDGLIILVIAASYYVGDWIAVWYLKRKTINERAIRYVSWANLIAWTLPLLGFFIAGLSHGFYVQSVSQSRKKYRILAFLGVVLSVLNGVGRIVFERLVQ